METRLRAAASPVKVVLNEIAGGSYTLLADVSHDTTTTVLLVLVVLSSSFQHKSQLFSSAPTPEDSSWFACHSYCSLPRASNRVRLTLDRSILGSTSLDLGSTVLRIVLLTSSTTKTTTMTTAAKLYGKDLSEYDDVDVDELLAQLTPEEINILAKEVDPDDSFMPPSQRCSYECDKSPTGPLNRKKLIEHINKQALETPDIPELKPYVPGVIRGKKWVPPPQESTKEKEAEEQIAIDLGEEYEQALSNATQEEIIDLAAILGFHSMMNQDQYHASLLNSGQPVGLGWDGVTKASQPKPYPMEPPNDTDVDATIKQVREDDTSLTDLNWNNIKNISDEKFIQLFEGLEINTHLESLSLTNVGLTDKTAQRLAEALEKNSTLRVLNVETNFISPSVIVRLIRALLKTKSIEEFRCSNQRSQVLGNKIEMEITQLVEQNPTLLRLGLHLEFNDARHRVAAHLQRNIDRIRKDLTLRLQFRFFNMNHRKPALIQ